MEWFSNHYRWIVWKLASLEVSFPHSFADKLVLCVDNVLHHDHHHIVTGGLLLTGYYYT